MNFILRICCALFATPFGLTLLSLTILESLGVFWLTKGGGGNREISFDWNLSAFGVSGIFLLVTVNTFIFNSHVSPILSPILQSSTLTKKERVRAKSHFRRLSAALYAGALVSAAIAALVMVAWSGFFRESSWPGQWTNDVRFSEYASCLIFFSFCYADWNALKLCHLAIRRGCTSCNIKAIEDEENNIQKYILAVDGPAFLGMIAIVAFGESMFPHSAADYRHASIPFWLGFSAGAITLHVAFSQASLAFLQASHRMLPLRCRDTMFIVGVLKIRRGFRSIKSWWR